MDIEQQIYDIVKRDKYAKAKALAYLMFRELAEDLHSNYEIPDEVIAALNKQAVNRAQAYLSIFDEENQDEAWKKFTGFIMNAIYGKKWDEPDSVETRKLHDDWKKIGSHIDA